METIPGPAHTATLPGVPEVGDPPGPALAPGLPQPEIQEPPPAPVEVPEPGTYLPEIPQR
ncbi:MAG TPA: hypothetical protein VGR77_05725 [Candidatus Dormibacteraeota bacterium]|nr:hypothetical protein [Candidatus Dormibacteraeota bacterium]